MSPLITLHGISKQYNQKVVLEKLDFQIQEGISLAFIGHNGCGKSTLLRIIAGLVRPTTGRVEYKKELLFHYVPEHFPKMNLTARRYLMSMGKMEGISRRELTSRCEGLMCDFFLEGMADIPMKDLSKGSLQKIGVIQALLKKPDVLLLDEPLSGQDVDSQEVFIRKIKDLKKEGVTVLMSCHETYLREQLSDKVYLIKGGKLTLEDQNVRLYRQEYVLWFERTDGAVLPEGLPAPLENMGGRYRIRVSEEESRQIVGLLIQKGWKLRGMKEAEYERAGKISF